MDKLRKDLRKKSCLLKDAQVYISKLERRRDLKPEVNLLKDKIESLEDEKRYLTKVKRELEDDLVEIKLEKDNKESIFASKKRFKIILFELVYSRVWRKRSATFVDF